MSDKVDTLYIVQPDCARYRVASITLRSFFDVLNAIGAASLVYTEAQWRRDPLITGRLQGLADAYDITDMDCVCVRSLMNGALRNLAKDDRLRWIFGSSAVALAIQVMEHRISQHDAISASNHHDRK